jgi:hypothetical protein
MGGGATGGGATGGGATGGGATGGGATGGGATGGGATGDAGLTLVFSSSGPIRAPDVSSLDASYEITRVTFDVDFLQGAQIDYAIAVFRPASVPVPYPAITGGYAEALATHPLRFATSGHWHQELDLSASPLYLPADTSITCWSSAGNDAFTMGVRTCAVDVQPVSVRNRILRIPYLDAADPAGGGFFGSAYVSQPGWPLHVKGFLFYDGVIGSYHACLEHRSSSFALLDQHCLPDVTRNFTDDQISPGVEPVDWTLAASDILSANCTVQTSYDWDCAFYVIVEVPAGVAPGPANIFRDPGLLPPGALSAWCSRYIDGGVAVPGQRAQLCAVYNAAQGRSGTTPCTDAELIDECVAAYPP